MAPDAWENDTHREVDRELSEKQVIRFTGDSAIDRDRLVLNDQRYLKDLLGSATHVFIDEAQRIPNIGLTLKLIVDWLPDKYVIATGSATFALARQTEEPLTGRKRTLSLYPISYPELAAWRGTLEAKIALERWLIWGSYPMAVSIDNENERKLWLEELVNGYLYKDILEYSGIRHAGKIVDLLRLLAYQIGGQVSMSELGAQLSMTKETVAHYLDLWCKASSSCRSGVIPQFEKRDCKNKPILFLGYRNTKRPHQ